MQTRPETATVLDMLQRIPIFGGIAEEALQHVLDRAPSVTVRKDAFFFRQNERAESLFVLAKGQVAVVKSIGGHTYELARMDPGDCFGELELIDLCPRAASVLALEHSIASDAEDTIQA